MKQYLAIDIGASSGRHIVGRVEGGKLITEEVYRFPNGSKMQDGHLVWDVEELLGHVKSGIAAAELLLAGKAVPVLFDENEKTDPLCPAHCTPDRRCGLRRLHLQRQL